MRKLVAVAVAAILLIVFPTLGLAKEAHKGTGTPHVSGTITAWDDATKQGTVTDSANKQTTFGWNDQTKVEGTPKVGEHASVSYTKDASGKRMATHIHIGAKTAAPKSASK
jgi:hypothetical protein